VEYRKEPTELATTPELEQADTLELKAATNGHMVEPIEAAWLLWGKRRFLFWLTVCGTVLATIIAFVVPKRYTATTQLMPPDYGANSALAMALPTLGGSGAGEGTGSTITDMASRLLGLNSSNDIYTGVMQSRTVEDHIIQQYGLMNVYHARYPSDARKALAANTDIETDQNTGIISVAVTDKDPKRAAGMAQAYVSELNKVLARVNTSSAHRERVFLEKRLAKVKSQMEQASQDFSKFASENAAIDIPEQAKAMVGAAAELQGQLIVSESELQGLQQIYTDQNSRVRALKAQIVELQHQMDKFGGKNVNPATGSTLSKNELYPSIRQLPLLGVKYLDLYRENQIDEAVYELLTKEYEIAKLEEARDLPSAQVLDPAVVPQKKSWPHRSYFLLGGMFLSFLFGSCWILGKTAWERVDPRQPWKVLGQEVYGTCKNHPAAIRVARGVDRTANIFRRNHNSNGNGA
jgi:capsule polysaccharide export protein KpsE/RkpR